MIHNLTQFEQRLRDVFGSNMFTTIEVQYSLGHGSSWAYSMTRTLHEIDRLELVQAGTLSRFNIWRLK